MKTYPMPVGKPIYCKSADCTIDINDFFGFLYLEIESPLDIYIPVLSRRDNGLKTPLGK
jgi:hypothetical protein